MKTTLDWLGVATFRLTIGDLVVFLDAYMDRAPGAPPVGMGTADVKHADWILVGHSHFDHLSGAEIIANSTGARIIGSHETCRVMREKGVPESQLFPSQGGEHYRLSPNTTVRVYPSLHASTWIHTSAHSAVEETGHLNMTQDERLALAGLESSIRAAATAGTEHSQAMARHILGGAGSASDGGVLMYVVETPGGTLLFQDTSGCWSGVLAELNPDVSILAASGRGNHDGEPFQGSLAQFIAMEAEALRPETVILAHHDEWLPPVTPPGGVDVEPIRAEIARRLPQTRFLSPAYMDGTTLFE